MWCRVRPFSEKELENPNARNLIRVINANIVVFDPADDTRKGAIKYVVCVQAAFVYWRVCWVPSDACIGDGRCTPGITALLTRVRGGVFVCGGG